MKMLKKDCNKRTLIITFIYFLLPVMMATYCLLYPEKIYSLIDPFNKWFQKNPVQGFFAFGSIYLIWVPLTLPSSIMTLAGGFIFCQHFGPIKGYFLCMLAIWLFHPIAAVLAFMIGRYFLHDYLHKNVIQKIRIFDAIDRSLAKEGTRLMILLRV